MNTFNIDNPLLEEKKLACDKHENEKATILGPRSSQTLHANSIIWDRPQVRYRSRKTNLGSQVHI